MKEIDDEIRPHMTLERARVVRFLRVNHGSTWRSVAAWCYDLWGEPTWIRGGNQLYGRSLCALSAEMLGEDPSGEPWN